MVSFEKLLGIVAPKNRLVTRRRSIESVLRISQPASHIFLYSPGATPQTLYARVPHIAPAPGPAP